MKLSSFFGDRESIIKLGFIVFLVILAIFWIKRKEISEMEITKKKMEMFKAIYNQDIDSAKQIMEEMVDSSFYIN